MMAWRSGNDEGRISERTLRSVNTGIGDRLQTGKPPRYATQANSASYPMRDGK